MLRALERLADAIEARENVAIDAHDSAHSARWAAWHSS